MTMRMKDSGIEWIGEIPADWDVRKLSLIFKTIGSGTTPPTSNPEYFDGDFCWINTGDLNDGELYSCEKTITQKALQDCSALKLFPSNSLIIAMYGATIGKLCITRMVSATNQACCVLSQPIAAEIKYVFYWLLCGRERIISLALGGGQPNISQDLVRSLRLAMPSFDMQQRIAAYLDSRCAEIDAVIAAKQRQNALLKEQRQSVIFEAVTKGLDPTVTYKDSGVEWIGEIPEGWLVRKLKAVAWVQTGIAKGKDLSGEEDTVLVPYLRVANVQDGFLNLEEIATIEVRPTDVARYRLKNGDVLMNEGGDYDKLGRGHIWREEVPGCIHQNHVFAVRPFAIRSEWLNWYTGASPAQFYFMTRANQSTNLASISANNLKDLFVLCPSDIEQQQIADYLDTRCTELDRVVAANNAVIDKLKDYRQSLIYEVVTGKIAV